MKNLLATIFIVSLCVVAQLSYANDKLDIKHNSSLPVNIESDRLVVKSQQNVAIFRGNVVAKQGDLLLKSDKMEVFYHKKSPTIEKDKVGDDETSIKKGSLSKIKTSGSTYLKTGQNIVTSTEGQYDLDAAIITLNGDVILTQKDGNLRGDHFWYEISTGRSRLTSGVKNGKNTKPTRVKGVFIPSSNSQ